MTITEFLLSRIAEDEAVAHEVIEANKTDPVASEHDPECTTWATDGNFGQLAAYIDPQRLLAECAAKRAIIEWHQNWPVLVETKPTFEQDPSLQGTVVRAWQEIAWLTEREYLGKFGSEPPTAPILRIMAQVYADHPDFKAEWRI